MLATNLDVFAQFTPHDVTQLLCYLRRVSDVAATRGNAAAQYPVIRRGQLFACLFRFICINIVIFSCKNKYPYV